MIEELQIRDLGVIAETVLPLGPGFTAITGETGAGKTMVVTALGLLMGERADASSVRAGASQARVSGIVRIEATEFPDIAAIVDEVGGAIEDSELVLSRTVNAEGRSRAVAGGVGVPVGALGRLAEQLFAVHGQSEQLRLKSTAAQRETLDRFAGSALATVAKKYRAAHDERTNLERRITELRDTRDAVTAEANRLREELELIQEVNPEPGEERELASRIEVLANVEALRDAATAAQNAVANEGDDPMSRDAAGLIDDALHHLDRVTGVDPRLDAVANMLREARFQLADAGRDLAEYASDLDEEGPAELERANERMSALKRVLRLFGEDTEAVLAYAETAAERLADIEGEGSSEEALTALLDECLVLESELAGKLTELRSKAATKLRKGVTAELRQLALPDADFIVTVEPLGSFAGHGADEVQFLLSPHPGASPRPVAKSASGGELSRVMLALEVVLAGADPVPTFVFDEVDAGIGGAAAIEIGRRLARLAQTSQVIVVTHLAQVAAFANNHLQVVKDSSGGFTESSCTRLEGEARIDEMARLLSGLSSSESAREHANELLNLAP
ncbi:DNA repair protein RecN [Leucobacter sp. cx-328]|uniref:DNA repair protein RecN n=1 Tax=unclassified Leucobacter TaxID=2621730 RepID=UPI00165EBD5E|nr:MULTISPECIES: DNA repair protein RecN [unclassified Leucobacter]MBC9944397.1 DNA repair protein RecN [Leucobacter sp. cx-328]